MGGAGMRETIMLKHGVFPDATIARKQQKTCNHRKKQCSTKTGQWIELESFDDFDNGLSDLIELWSSTSAAATNPIKESALAHFKQDLEAAALQWVERHGQVQKIRRHWHRTG